ncbi:MAG TPA: phosphoribosylglycinamide formyltransferase [Myxococcaceae bacterium]|nr:phosphoribosylglycinamide formyltransferase [Myxococcaceae bacterium]
MTTARRTLAVLVSGSGTNLQALLDASAERDFPARVGVVLSNVPGVRALERARAAGVPTVVVPHQDVPGRAAYDAALLRALAPHRPDIVCLAGFMRLVGPDFLRAFPAGVLNIHPALLPSFPGLHGVRQALAHGVKLTGCTVHLVDEGTDTGPIVAQSAVPVLDADTEESLAARIQHEEHRLYPLAVRLLAEGRLRREGRRILGGAPPREADDALRNPGAG